MALLPDDFEKMDIEEINALLARCSQGDLDAREKVILSFLPYVAKLCKSYNCYSVPYDDLFQEGCYGLMIAIEKYDLSSGIHFPTFARTYILKYVRRSIGTQTAYPVVFREDFAAEMRRYIQKMDELTLVLARTPTYKELSEELHTSEARIRTLSQTFYMFYPSEDNINLSNSFQGYRSAEDEVINNMRIFDIAGLNVDLTVREKEVICRRCGFTQSGIPESNSQIAESLGLSSETIRLTYNQAIDKIRRFITENRDKIDYIC